MSIPSRFTGAEAAKTEGMERVEASASAAWKALMLQIVVAVARKMPRFTTDEVFEIYYGLGHPPSTRDNRAMGPVMLHAAKQHICAKSTLWKQSRRRSRHAAPLQVWISLICEPTDLYKIEVDKNAGSNRQGQGEEKTA